MNLPMRWERLDEPARMRLIRQLDVLRGMVADGEPLHIHDTVEIIDGRRVAASTLTYDDDSYAKRWRAGLPDC